MALISAKPKIISVMTVRNNRRSPRALTFIELLLVAVLIGILVGVSIPQMRKTFDDFELENFVKDIYYLTHYLQTSAIYQGKIFCLNINQDEGFFYATYKENDEAESNSEPKKIEGRFGRDYKPPEGTSIFIEPLTEPLEVTTICFYPDGSKDKIMITLKNRHEKEITLSIKGAAGEIQIQ